MVGVQYPPIYATDVNDSICKGLERDTKDVRNCLKRSGHSQSPEHQVAHRYVHHRFTGFA
jgi:hypothetical protein